MKPLDIQIAGLGLDTVVGADYEGGVTLGELIVKEATTRLIKDAEHQTINDGLRMRISKIRDEEIRKLVTAELDAAMAAPVTATNQWGEPVGKPTTLRALIVDAATKFFTEKKSTDSYDRAARFTDAERVVATLVKDTLTKEVAAAFAEEKAKVVAAVQKHAAELLAKAVKDGLR